MIRHGMSTITPLLLSAVLIHTCVCQRGLSSLHWNRRFGLSYKDCLEECDRTSQCAVIKFTRRYHLCELYTTIPTSYVKVPGEKLTDLRRESSASPEYSSCEGHERCDVLDGDQASCVPEYCPVPETIPGTERYGNVVTFGSKIQYECLNTGLGFQRTCLSNGSWSETTLPGCCFAGLDDMSHATFDYDPLNETFIELVLSCDPGYDLLEITPAKCNVLAGKWYDKHKTGCYMLWKDPWKKIYSYTSLISDSIIGHWIDESYFIDDMDQYGQYRNSTVFNNWATEVTKRIRVDILQDWKVVKQIFFNAISSDMFDWFSNDRLLNSSWSDLNADTMTDRFALRGHPRPHNSLFLIAKTFNPTYNCIEDSGWFAVSWAFYPCDINMRGVTIMFASGDNVSKFQSNELDFADRFEVWIEV